MKRMYFCTRQDKYLDKLTIEVEDCYGEGWDRDGICPNLNIIEWEIDENEKKE